MKIALIMPDSNSKERTFYDYKFFSSFLLSKKHLSYLLSIPTLVSLTPPEHEIKIFDERIEDIDYDWEADIVGITVLTMTAPRAYEISENYRRRGTKTVLGGVHPYMCPDEALEHCDSVIIGEADVVWHKLLKDAQTGETKRVYKAERTSDLTKSPVANRSLLSKDKYFSDILQTTKGCPFYCDFCTVHAFDGQKIRHKSVDQIIKEIKEIQGTGTNIKKRSIFFADDNIIANKKFTRELLEALKPYNLNWSCQATINISKEYDLLQLMKESGCGAILIGFESVSQNSIRNMDKKINLRYDYANAIKKIQSHGIMIHGSFILGSDSDSLSSFDELINFIEENNLLMCLINILTPFPGTKLLENLEKEGRIIHKDWSKYNTANVVFYPKQMTPEELYNGFRKVYKQVYSFDSILKKLEYYWDIDFWKHSNEVDPIKFKYRLIFAIRLFTLLASTKIKRSKFILKILPKVFHSRVRISTILTLMAYNDYADSL